MLCTLGTKFTRMLDGIWGPCFPKKKPGNLVRCFSVEKYLISVIIVWCRICKLPEIFWKKVESAQCFGANKTCLWFGENSENIRKVVGTAEQIVGITQNWQKNFWSLWKTAESEQDVLEEILIILQTFQDRLSNYSNSFRKKKRFGTSCFCSFTKFLRIFCTS